MRFVISLLALMLVIAWDATANETDAPRELWIDSTELLADQDTPRFCVQFNRPIDVDDSVSIDAFVRIEPESDTGISARRNLLCIDGLNHGGRYTVRLLEGLPGIDARLMSEQTLDVVVPNREPVVEFPSGGYVLPAVGSAGIPVETVNVETLALKIYRVNDRSLADELRNGLVFGDLYDWTMGQLADQNGELVWQGEVDITNEPEQRIRTAIPVAETIGSLEPGIYAAAAVEASVLDQEYYWYDWATQWFVVSDLGLTAMIGETGLHATARALSTGEPLADVAFELIARNNAVLVIEQSDADGLAAFDPGFARGQGGNAPRVLIARLGDDFAFLDLETAPMDLSDRGVEGRLPPEALDAFVYTERGIYRPGETVHVVALLRNSEAMAVQDVGLTLRLLRPDGVEAIKDVVPDNGGGSHPWAIVLPGNAYTGSWTLQVLVGDGDPVGSVQFLVEDFVPPRIEFELSTDPEILNADDDDAMATVDAGYLYGGQAAGLTGEASFSFDHARDPFSRDDGYEFGLIEEDLPVSYDIASFTTDAAGDASFPIWLDQIGNVTSPIDVTVHAQIFDVGGRPVGRNATMTVLNSDTLIGIKPLFAESTIRWGEDALFEIAAYGSNGERLALDGLQWNLVREDYDWRWYDAGWRWEYQGFYWDEPIASGSLDALCDDATVISQSVTWGRFRLEVYDPATGAATSVRFRSGWRSTPNVADAPPDRVTVTVSDAAYKPGDTATLFIDPPFDARVALAVMDDGVRDIRFLDIPEAGAEVELKVDAAWTPGVYVVATAYGAPDPLVPTIPQRALGLAWVEVDLEGQRLDIGLVAPELIEPETTLTTTVTVEGAGDGEEVFVTLAAVDDGVLQLTRYAAPDPQDYFLGQRSLGVAIRDLYGRLIDSSGAISGIPRQGGDALQGGGLAGALPKRSSRVVALFSGVLPVIDGTVEIPLDVPDFNGRLRVMAVAWSPRGTGQAETTVQVSAPIIADLSLPRFLAPGDLSTATLAIDNLRAPEGSYEFFLTAEGAVEVLQPWGSVAMLNAGEQARSTFRLETKEIGTARIELVINPPEGDSIVRSWDLSVRPSTPLTTTRRLISIPPGTSYLVPTADTQGYYADGLTVSLTADSTPPLDTVQLLRSLYLYPYGCAEQTTSRAMPLLYAASLPGAEQAL
ncbi:MAG: alpha-2-macroglobulin family protein, partial [Rhodospirillaceae bacterium]|nr:alpha-2-macroglobulin family protein [Rhodospirillaceae bacterium]